MRLRSSRRLGKKEKLRKKVLELKEKNRRLKLQVNGYQIREKLIMWLTIVLLIVVVFNRLGGTRFKRKTIG